MDRYGRVVARSALVALVGEAEPLVALSRLVHDPMAARGVPAHVTVLHPFRDVVDEETARTVAQIVSGIDRFDATFRTVGRFPGEVVFLQPEPLERFKEMTRRFVDAFPDCPPYGGAFPDPHPHLTVGSGVTEETADYLEQAMTIGLPIESRIDRLTLLVEDEDGQWTVATSWPCGTPGTANSEPR